MGRANGLPSWPLVINHINDALITDIDADHGGSRQRSVVASFVPNQMEGRRFFVATRRQEKSHANSERNSELRNKGRHFRALPSDEAGEAALGHEAEQPFRRQPQDEVQRLSPEPAHR